MLKWNKLNNFYLEVSAVYGYNISYEFGIIGGHFLVALLLDKPTVNVSI